MRLAEIHIYSHRLPVVGGPFRIATSVVETLDTTLVKGPGLGVTPDEALWGDPITAFWGRG